jgi:hypothetical protein
MRGLNLSLALAVVLFVLGVVQMVKPFSAAPVNPYLMLVAAVLLAARYFAVRQRIRRDQLLRSVPKHPLGLSDEDED